MRNHARLQIVDVDFPVPPKGMALAIVELHFLASWGRGAVCFALYDRERMCTMSDANSSFLYLIVAPLATATFDHCAMLHENSSIDDVFGAAVLPSVAVAVALSIATIAVAVAVAPIVYLRTVRISTKLVALVSLTPILETCLPCYSSLK
jgi:hypothetical protein